MKASMKFTLASYCIAFVLPILGTLNCSGWNEGTMSVKKCLIPGKIFVDYANYVYEWLLISAFLAFIPVVLYVAAVIFFTRWFSKQLD